MLTEAAANITSNVLVEIFVPTGLAITGLFAWVVKKLANHDTALAVLIQQVNPPGDKSLRSLLQEIQLEQARQGSHIPPKDGAVA